MKDTTVFQISFKYLSPKDVLCRWQGGAGTFGSVNYTWLQYGIDYDVSPINTVIDDNSDDLSQPVSSVLTLLIDLPEEAETLLIRRSTPTTQEVDLHDGSRISADLLENIADKAVMNIQEIEQQQLSEDKNNTLLQDIEDKINPILNLWQDFLNSFSEFWYNLYNIIFNSLQEHNASEEAHGIIMIGKANKHIRALQDGSKETIDFTETLAPIDGNIIGSQVITVNTTENGELYFDKDKTPTQVKEEIKSAYDPLIPNQASPSNQLADKDFVNSSINHLAARRVTYTINGEPFPSRQSLLSANTVYSNGEEYIPTIHDYCIILSDEDAPAPWTNGQTWMEYSGSQWEFDFGVNNKPFTAAENAAIQSGITSSHVEKINNPDTKPTLDSDKLITSGGVFSWFGFALTSLLTASKTIIGAINELHEKINSITNKAMFMAAHPVNSIYMTVDPDESTPEQMAAKYGGTWARWGAGRVPVSLDLNDPLFNAVEKTGGSKDVTLTAAQSGVPAHLHPNSLGQNPHAHAGSSSGWWKAPDGNYSNRYCVANGGSEGTTHTIITSGATIDMWINNANNTAQNASQAHDNIQPSP